MVFNVSYLFDTLNVSSHCKNCNVSIYPKTSISNERQLYRKTIRCYLNTGFNERGKETNYLHFEDGHLNYAEAINTL